MTDKKTNAPQVEPGVAALVMLLRFQGVAADPKQIRHQFGEKPIGVPEMLRCAKQFGLKARCLTSRWERLPNTPLPGIAVLRDGGFLLVGKPGDDKIIVQAPNTPQPRLMTREEFEIRLGWPDCLDGQAREFDRSRAAVRSQLVFGSDP